LNRDEAAALLGIASSSPPAEVRAAYRTRIRVSHPDRAGDQATDDAARINEAYAVLRRPAAPKPPKGGGRSVVDSSASGHRRAGTPVVQVVDDGTLAVAIPTDELFLLLLNTANDVGEVTYADPEGGLIEAIVAFADPSLPVCSVVLSLQGRSDRVEAFCTVASLDGTTPPPIADVVALLAARIRQRL